MFQLQNTKEKLQYWIKYVSWSDILVAQTIVALAPKRTIASSLNRDVREHVLCGLLCGSSLRF